MHIFTFPSYGNLHKTQCKNEGRIQSIPVTKNLTLHRMSKIEFQPDFLNPQMHSFLNMYNTMGKKWTVWP